MTERTMLKTREGSVDVTLDKAKRAVRQMSAAYAMVLAIHGEPLPGGCLICEWLRTTSIQVGALEGLVVRYLGGAQPKLGDKPPEPEEPIAAALPEADSSLENNISQAPETPAEEEWL